MGHQRESDVRNSVSFAYIHRCKYGGSLKEQMNNDNLILYCQISPYYFVSQPSDTTKNVTNCIS